MTVRSQAAVGDRSTPLIGDPVSDQVDDDKIFTYVAR